MPFFRAEWCKKSCWRAQQYKRRHITSLLINLLGNKLFFKISRSLPYPTSLLLLSLFFSCTISMCASFFNQVSFTICLLNRYQKDYVSVSTFHFLFSLENNVKQSKSHNYQQNPRSNIHLWTVQVYSEYEKFRGRFKIIFSKVRHNMLELHKSSLNRNNKLLKSLLESHPLKKTDRASHYLSYTKTSKTKCHKQ